MSKLSLFARLKYESFNPTTLCVLGSIQLVHGTAQKKQKKLKKWEKTLRDILANLLSHPNVALGDTFTHTHAHTKSVTYYLNGPFLASHLIKQ
jgi:hypothetical protein